MMSCSRARAWTAFRTPRPGCQPTLPLEYPLDVIISITASTIAYDHRETSCEGPTGRRSRILAPEAFYHPVSVDLVNGDDPGGGVKYPTVPGAMVAVLLEALGADGKPLRFYDQEQQPLPKAMDEYERHLPAERASAMLQRATALNGGIGIDRWQYDEAHAASRPRLLERSYSFDMCQAFNIGAALALRTFLRERNAVLRMNDGRTIPPDRITIVQAKSPSPLHGVHIGFIYTCAERGIGFDKPKMMAGSHMWIQLDEEYNLDFACQQFGLGEVVDAPPSSSTKPEQQKSGSTRPSKPKHTKRFEPAAQLRTRTDGSMRPWALLEQVGSDKSVLRPPAWRADAATMSSLEREGERGCGLSGCGACGARVFGTAEAPRGPREGEGDPISLLVHAPELWEEGWNTKARGPDAKRGTDGQSHACRRWRACLLASLRERFPV